MDWFELVRRSLTYPSGRLLPGVSAAEYRSWMRCARDGSLAEIYKNYEERRPHTAMILSLARFNSKEGTVW